MKKLKEVDTGYGVCLERVQEFDDEEAKNLLALQERTKIVAWVEVADDVPEKETAKINKGAKPE